MNFSPRDLSQTAAQEFDVIIVGGGVTGAWLALHCAQQGYKTALIERGDYASATSSASSKLLHGGIRYLQQLHFGKVRESAMERAEYVYSAPHLSRPVPFAVPTYADFKRSKLFLKCGMMAYSLLCTGENRLINQPEQKLSPARSISRKKLNDICDLSHINHTGAVVYYERHMPDSERMVLAIIQTARKFGAQTFNYVSATSLLGDDSVVRGVTAKDELTGDTFNISAKLVVNCAGPWIDTLNCKLRNADRAPKISGFAIGSHIITRKISDYALALATKHQSDAKIDRGGRHVFLIPWRGYSLIGTSYDEVSSPDGDLSIQPEQVASLLADVNDALPSVGLTRADIVSGYSGLYPLQTDAIESTVYQGTGEYRIIDHAETNDVSGLVTALGAKFTTGRKVSALTMPLIAKALGRVVTLKRTKLNGCDYKSYSRFLNSKLTQYKGLFCPETISHITTLYGTGTDDFFASIADQPALQARLCIGQPDLAGQVIWAVDYEQALTVDDVLYRRTSLGLLGIKPIEVEAIADLMADRLGWTSEERLRQLSGSLDYLARTRKAVEG
jgi:glycerol-3-phosphate dehydrogenase